MKEKYNHILIINFVSLQTIIPTHTLSLQTIIPTPTLITLYHYNF